MHLFLNLPGSPTHVPDWLVLLAPLVLLVVIMQGGQLLFRWYKHRFVHHSHPGNMMPGRDSEPQA